MKVVSTINLKVSEIVKLTSKIYHKVNSKVKVVSTIYLEVRSKVDNYQRSIMSNDKTCV